MTCRFWLNSVVQIQFDSAFLIKSDSILRFDLTTTKSIWLTVSDSTHLFWLNFNHHIQSVSTHNFTFNLTQLYHLIRRILYPFESPFLIWLRYPDLISLEISNWIWISIYDSTWLGFTIWFEYHYTHLTNNFQLDSIWLNISDPHQLRISYSIWFSYTPLIQHTLHPFI